MSEESKVAPGGAEPQTQMPPESWVNLIWRMSEINYVSLSCNYLLPWCGKHCRTWENPLDRGVNR